jgi:hypothetical protein
LVEPLLETRHLFAALVPLLEFRFSFAEAQG